MRDYKLEVIKIIKEELIKKGIKNPHTRSVLKPHPERDFRRVGTGRLMDRLDISRYDTAAPLRDIAAESVSIPLRQHIGAAAEPTDKPGDRVKKGDLIAEIPAGALGARIHASIPGVVKAVGRSNIEIGS